MQPIEPEMSIKVFISYTHADQELRKKLEEHLSPLKHSGGIAIWQDQEIPAGADWEAQINTHLDEADVILLLISSSFIASNYCWNKEVRAALERHKAGTVQVIPILLRSALWEDTPLGQLQVLPTGAKPVTQWEDQDDAFDSVVRGIRKVVEDLRVKLRQNAQRGAAQEQLQGKRQRSVSTIQNLYEQVSRPVSSPEPETLQNPAQILKDLSFFLGISTTLLGTLLLILQNMRVGSAILFFGLMLVFIARIRKSFHPMSNFRRIEAGIGILVGIIGTIFSFWIIALSPIIGYPQWWIVPVFGGLTFLESTVILFIVWLTHFRKSGVSQI